MGVEDVPAPGAMDPSITLVCRTRGGLTSVATPVQILHSSRRGSRASAR